MRYSDLYTTPEDLTASIQNSGAINSVQVFATAAEAKAWVIANTDLVEDANGFLVQEAMTDIDGTDIPAKYLVIN